MPPFTPYNYGGYTASYQPNYYQPPMQDQLSQLRQAQYQPQQPPAQTPPSNGIIWVQGEEGAKGFLVAAGNSVLLMDSEKNSFYIKATDASGMPQPLRIFDYAERVSASKTASAPLTETTEEYVTRKEFEALAARLDEISANPADKEKEND